MEARRAGRGEKGVRSLEVRCLDASGRAYRVYRVLSDITWSGRRRMRATQMCALRVRNSSSKLAARLAMTVSSGAAAAISTVTCGPGYSDKWEAAS